MDPKTERQTLSRKVTTSLISQKRRQQATRSDIPSDTGTPRWCSIRQTCDQCTARCPDFPLGARFTGTVVFRVFIGFSNGCLYESMLLHLKIKTVLMVSLLVPSRCHLQALLLQLAGWGYPTARNVGSTARSWRPRNTCSTVRQAQRVPAPAQGNRYVDLELLHVQ